MKRILAMILSILVCFLLTSCAAIEALKYSISGDIIDPVDGFSRGEEKGTLIYNDNNYIIVQEINGDCDIDITEEDILLGYSSNFPFFPNSYYYVSTDENPDFIMGGTTSAMIGTFVYLKEDIYSNDIVYVLSDGSFDFLFASAFVKTDQVDYDVHISGEKYTKYAMVDFYMKEIPTITAHKQIYLIDNTWYCVEVGIAYQLSDEFVCKLMDEGTIN